MGTISNKTAILIKIVIKTNRKTYIQKLNPELIHSKVKHQMQETINSPSPKPKIINPRQRKKEVENLGFKFNGLSELHDTFGIFLIFKNIF